MTEDSAAEDGLASFTAERPRLLGLAYRMLGTLDDAEDVVQEAWLRWQLADASSIDRPAAWLTTVTSRLCLDRLRSAVHRRETYVGPWLPEPVSVERGPEEVGELVESLTVGFLVMLDQLTPPERLIFLLADVFGEPYSAIAAVTGRSEASCRQVAHRARQRLRGAPEPSRAPSEADEALVVRLLAAVYAGDVAATMSLLADDAVLVSDGGPERRAARRPVRTSWRVGRLLIGLAKRTAPDWTFQPCRMNGLPAIVAGPTGTPDTVLIFEAADGVIKRIWAVRAPDKLHHLDETVSIV